MPAYWIIMFDNSTLTLHSLQSTEWFGEWFDSPFYYWLYKERNDSEAHGFIDALLDWLQPGPGARFLDLACGRGRYARYLAQKDLEVTGLDLSVSSISYARQYEQANLSFFTHDMRRVFRVNYFDFVVNFFTSFGYFEKEKDHLESLKSVAKGLRAGGVFVLDFLNHYYVRTHLLAEEAKTIDGLTFHLSRWIENGHVHKSIQFQFEGQRYFFEEKVRLFSCDDLKIMLLAAGLTPFAAFGNYQLGPFLENESPRLILISRKQ